MNDLADGDTVECWGFLWTVMGCSVRSTKAIRVYEIARSADGKIITHHANTTEMQARR